MVCPNCEKKAEQERDLAEELVSKWARGELVERNKVKWHKYPDEKPEKEGRYLVCTPLSILPTPEPMIDIIWWGKSAECEWYDKKLKKKKRYWYNYDSEWGDHTVDDVYAWMPLPEPMPLKEETK